MKRFLPVEDYDFSERNVHLEILLQAYISIAIIIVILIQFGVL